MTVIKINDLNVPFDDILYGDWTKVPFRNGYSYDCKIETKEYIVTLRFTDENDRIVKGYYIDRTKEQKFFKEIEGLNKLFGISEIYHILCVAKEIKVA